MNDITVCKSEGMMKIIDNDDKSIFFSKYQTLNRDITLAIVLSFLSCDGKKVDPKIIDACCGNGTRAIRYSLGIQTGCKVIGIDKKKRCIEIANRNAILNKVENFASFINGDAIDEINLLSPASFDIIEIDPFGNSLPYLSSALRIINNSGLICLNFTDANTLFSDNAKFFSTYGTTKPLFVATHEFSLRAVLFSIHREVMNHEMQMSPLACWSYSHGCRMIIQIFHSNSNLVAHPIPLGNNDIIGYASESADRTHADIISCSTQTISEHLESARLYGPLWIHSLINREAISKALELVTNGKMDGQLSDHKAVLSSLKQLLLTDTIFQSNMSTTITANPRPILTDSSINKANSVQYTIYDIRKLSLTSRHFQQQHQQGQGQQLHPPKDFRVNNKFCVSCTMLATALSQLGYPSYSLPQDSRHITSTAPEDVVKETISSCFGISLSNARIKNSSKQNTNIINNIVNISSPITDFRQPYLTTPYEDIIDSTFADSSSSSNTKKRKLNANACCVITDSTAETFMGQTRMTMSSTQSTKLPDNIADIIWMDDNICDQLRLFYDCEGMRRAMTPKEDKEITCPEVKEKLHDSQPETIFEIPQNIFSESIHGQQQKQEKKKERWYLNIEVVIPPLSITTTTTTMRSAKESDRADSNSYHTSPCLEHLRQCCLNDHWASLRIWKETTSLVEALEQTQCRSNTSTPNNENLPSSGHEQQSPLPPHSRRGRQINQGRPLVIILFLGHNSSSCCHGSSCNSENINQEVNNCIATSTIFAKKFLLPPRCLMIGVSQSNEGIWNNITKNSHNLETVPIFLQSNSTILIGRGKVMIIGVAFSLIDKDDSTCSEITQTDLLQGNGRNGSSNNNSSRSNIDAYKQIIQVQGKGSKAILVNCQLFTYRSVSSLRHPYGGGISVTKGAEIVLIRCHCSDLTTAIYSSGKSNILFYDGVISNCAQDGVILTGGSTANISESTISKCKCSGIKLTTESHLHIMKCTSTSNSRCGIETFSSIILLENCTLSKNGGGGLLLSTNSTGDISNCTSTLNRLANITVMDGSTATICRTTCSHGHASGVYVTGSDSVAKLTSCSTFGNSILPYEVDTGGTIIQNDNL